MLSYDPLSDVTLQYLLEVRYNYLQVSMTTRRHQNVYFLLQRRYSRSGFFFLAYFCTLWKCSGLMWPLFACVQVHHTLKFWITWPTLKKFLVWMLDDWNPPRLVLYNFLCGNLKLLFLYSYKYVDKMRVLCSYLAYMTCVDPIFKYSILPTSKFRTVTISMLMKVTKYPVHAACSVLLILYTKFHTTVPFMYEE
jgi:hypothetical protein